MSGWRTVYLDCGDEATARALGMQLGAEHFQPESRAYDPEATSAGNENYTFIAYRQWDRWPGTNAKDDPGEAKPGYWVLARFNTDLPAGLAAYNAVQASGFVRPRPATPSNVWAGDA